MNIDQRFAKIKNQKSLILVLKSRKVEEESDEQGLQILSPGTSGLQIRKSEGIKKIIF